MAANNYTGKKVVSLNDLSGQHFRKLPVECTAALESLFASQWNSSCSALRLFLFHAFYQSFPSGPNLLTLNSGSFLSSEKFVKSGYNSGRKMDLINSNRHLS